MPDKVDAPGSYLDVYLAPLSLQLERHEVTDLWINRPGELWVETIGGETERIEAPEITEAQLWRLARQIASISHQAISREHPLLAARLPDGSRVQVVAPPATREGMAIAIRKHIAARLSLADYEDSGAFAEVSVADDGEATNLASLYEQRSWGAFLREAVRRRKTIIVSGGTSTGKTTFLNALLAEVDHVERLLLIEDTPEISLTQPNAIGLVAARSSVGEAQVSSQDLLIAALRMRPDRIILGELRGTEAFTFLRAVNTGHPGSMTTIHADSPAGAIEQLVLLALQSGVQLSRADILDYIRQVVDIVVQLGRRGGGRIITKMYWERRN